jgi:CheY-like chemotaxis protein
MSLDQDAPPVERRGDIPDAAENPQHLRFLIADDSGVNRRVAAIQLEHHGHFVRTANDGAEAVSMVEREPFDCVLMDVQMPVIDGLDATRRIRERERRLGGHVAIIAITADFVEETRRRCLSAGMDAFVTKPIDPVEAVAMARDVMGRRHDVVAAGVDTVTPGRPQIRRTGRMSADELRRQYELVMAAPGIREVLDRIPQPTVVIGRYRQIVYANPASRQLMPGSVDAILGRRPGETLGCRHSDETAGGCGTTKFCATCGVAKALRAGQRREAASGEGRIASKIAGDDRELRVWSAPLELGGQHFSLFTIVDISDEKRRLLLERVFLHDVLNTAGGIQGTAAMCKDATPAERVLMWETVGRLSRSLIDELHAQQALGEAEDGELKVRIEVLSSVAVLREVSERYRAHEVAVGRTIALAHGAADVAVMCDATLLGRVVGNMVKNALEACPPGGVVTLDCGADETHVEYRVHNPTGMPRDVQLQLFQRSFSTKGAGRGLGTYSMRLLTERYLGGTVTFSSSAEAGTTFIARYPLTGPA